MPEANVYSWAKLPMDAPMASLERRRVVGERAMLSHVTLRRGCVVPSHSHANEQFVCILSGALRMGVGVPGSAEHRVHVIRAGGVLYLPSDVPHSAEAIEDTVVLDVFSPPSAMTGIDPRA